MNKLTYVSFHKVGWEQPLGEVVNFVVFLLQIYNSICLLKIMRFDKVIAEIIRVQFFCLTVYLLDMFVCVSVCLCVFPQ